MGCTVLGFAQFLGERKDEPDIDSGFWEVLGAWCLMLGAVVGQTHYIRLQPHMQERALQAYVQIQQRFMELCLPIVITNSR